jgi:hypothetical protein
MPINLLLKERLQANCAYKVNYRTKQLCYFEKVALPPKSTHGKKGLTQPEMVWPHGQRRLYLPCLDEEPGHSRL